MKNINTSQSPSRRENWLDIAKGLGIIAVVFGHSGNPYSFILFWFHMPLFFFLSGYVHKKQNNLKHFIRKKSKQLLIPYFCFYFVILLMQKIYSSGHLAISQLDVIYLFKGGQYLTGFWGPFWFITVLYLTIIGFELILNIKSQSKRVVIIVLFYFGSYLISYMSQNYMDYKFYWNMDVVLIAMVFYALGYLYKNKNYLINFKIVLGCCSIVLMTLLSFKAGVFQYYLDMKNNKYDAMIIDILVPVSFIVIIMYMSKILEQYRFSSMLTYLGKHSLIIMYLHIPVNYLLRDIVAYSDLEFLLVGIIIPLIVNYIFLRNFLLLKKCF